MIALLPEAAQAIDMMADWITESFQRFDEKQEKLDRKVTPPRTVTAPPRFGTPPIRTTKPPSAPHPPPSASKAGFTSESDRDDETNVLSFTPKKRRPSNSGSRGESPVPSSVLSDSTSPPAIEFPRTAGLSSSDESRSTPHTPDSRLSPPSLPSYSKGSPSDFGWLHLPHQPSPRRFFSSEVVERSMSDDDSLSLGAGLAPPAPLTSKKTSRSGSGSQPLPPNFIDAKNLLRRRREEAVFGISATNSAAGSAVASDDEDAAPTPSPNPPRPC